MTLFKWALALAAVSLVLAMPALHDPAALHDPVATVLDTALPIPVLLVAATWGCLATFVCIATGRAAWLAMLALGLVTNVLARGLALGTSPSAAMVRGVFPAAQPWMFDVGTVVLVALGFIGMLGALLGKPKPKQPKLESAPTLMAAAADDDDDDLGPGDVCVFKTGPRDVEMTIVSLLDRDVVPGDYTGTVIVIDKGRFSEVRKIPWWPVRVSVATADGGFETRIVPYRMLTRGRAVVTEEKTTPEVGDVCVYRHDTNSLRMTVIRVILQDESVSDYRDFPDALKNDNDDACVDVAYVSYCAHSGQDEYDYVPLHSLVPIEIEWKSDPVKHFDEAVKDVMHAATESLSRPESKTLPVANGGTTVANASCTALGDSMPVANAFCTALGGSMPAPDPLKAKRDELEAARLALEDARQELADAKSEGRYANAGELAYGRIPELESQVARLTGELGLGHLNNAA